MRTNLKIASVCIGMAFLVLGCAGTSGLNERRKAVQQRKQRIDAAIEGQKDVFEVVWDNVEVHDREYLRSMLSIDVDMDDLYVTTDDGLLFILDSASGRRRAAYMPGSTQPIMPPVIRGSYLQADFLYLVQDNCIHAIDRPDREGLLTAAWIARHGGTIATPLCETEDALFFGDRDQGVYALLKGATEGRNEIRFIDKLDASVNVAPVTISRLGRPFFLNSGGRLYRFGSRYATVLQPLQSALGFVRVPMLIDDPSATLLIASDNFKLYAIDVNDPRTIKWNAELGSRPGEAMYIYDRAVYVINENGELRAFSLDETPAGLPGKHLWGGNPVMNVRKIISKGESGVLYVLRAGNRIGKLDTAAGKIVWEREMPQVDYLPVNRLDSTIYLGIKEGLLWALRPR